LQRYLLVHLEQTYVLVHVFLFQCDISEMHRPIGVKFCTAITDQYWVEFYNAGPKFFGASQKHFRGQNMQNLAQ